MALPLNPSLHRLLLREFHEVRIANEGEAMVAHYGRRATSGEEELLVETTGEQYKVNCPRCNDTRFRLYIGHMWGVKDEKGKKNLWLMYCQNENCWTRYEDREAFYDRITSTWGIRAFTRIRKGATLDNENRIASLPGPCYPLHTLDNSHPAISYLTDRGFNTQQLGRFWRVSYCPESPFYLARNRIVAPVYVAGHLRGWQCRHIGDLPKSSGDKIPKWWTDPGMKKRQWLYNYDNAIRCHTGVVVEGPSSAWGCGPMAVATFGSSVSESQLQLLARGFAGRSICWLWDPDVQKDPHKLKHLEKAMLRLKQLEAVHHFEVAKIWLPDGMDPGSADRNWLHAYIKQEATKLGVVVRFETARPGLQPI